MRAEKIATVNGWDIYRITTAERTTAYAVANATGCIASFQESKASAEGWAFEHETADFQPRAGTFEIRQ